MLWRVTNLLSTSVSIEDLGITLQARGGEDSSATISDESRNASRSLKNLVGARWVQLSPYSSGSQKMPAWPFSKPASPTPEPPPEPTPAIRPPPVAAPDPVMLETMRKLEATLAELAAAMRHNPTMHIPASTTALFTPSVFTPSSPAAPEPVFIPETIVPKDAKSEIHVKKDEVSSDSLESSASALKKLRKPK